MIWILAFLMHGVNCLHPNSGSGASHEDRFESRLHSHHDRRAVRWSDAESDSAKWGKSSGLWTGKACLPSGAVATSGVLA